mmetsp:Transcript_7485/g.10316  ORF Transcript_7485/g.10316 Transcript_7485/m.10316 type:complete len:329 (+) Transcript_7485:52-1038(+)
MNSKSADENPPCTPLTIQNDGISLRLRKNHTSSEPKSSSRLGRTNSMMNLTTDENKGHYHPTGYVHPNAKPLKSCLSNSNLSSMNRTMTEPNLSGMTKMRRNISFHRVEIREYERAVGVHPVSSGCHSLTLGWEYNPELTVLDFELYEEDRMKRSKGYKVSAVPDIERRRLLRYEADATKEELQEAKREIRVTRDQRRRTNQLLQHKQREKLEESLQSAKRKIRRFVTGTSKEKEEEKLWRNAEKSLKNCLSREDVSASSSSGSIPSMRVSLESESNETEESTTAASNTELSSSLPAEDQSGGDDWEFSYTTETSLSGTCMMDHFCSN